MHFTRRDASGHIVFKEWDVHVVEWFYAESVFIRAAIFVPTNRQDIRSPKFVAVRPPQWGRLRLLKVDFRILTGRLPLYRLSIGKSRISTLLQ
jgi:hypothetical protein